MLKKIPTISILAILTLVSCDKEEINIAEVQVIENSNIKGTAKGAKVDICHKGKIINVSVNALPAHLKHGDIQLIDEDGDGYVTQSNSCGIPVDCDDSDPSVNEVCVSCPVINVLTNLNISRVIVDELGFNGPPLYKIFTTDNSLNEACFVFVISEDQLGYAYWGAHYNTDGIFTDYMNSVNNPIFGNFDNPEEIPLCFDILDEISAGDL